MSQSVALTPETSDGYDEEWKVVLNNGAEYTLGLRQALLVQEAIASGNRGIIMFQSFSISLPYIIEFYRVRRFKPEQYALPAKATEEPWTEKDRIRSLAMIQSIKSRLSELKRQLPEDNVIRGETPTAT